MPYDALKVDGPCQNYLFNLCTIVFNTLTHSQSLHVYLCKFDDISTVRYKKNFCDSRIQKNTALKSRDAIIRNRMVILNRAETWTRRYTEKDSRTQSP